MRRTRAAAGPPRSPRSRFKPVVKSGDQLGRVGGWRAAPHLRQCAGVFMFAVPHAGDMGFTTFRVANRRPPPYSGLLASRDSIQRFGRRSGVPGRAPSVRVGDVLHEPSSGPPRRPPVDKPSSTLGCPAHRRAARSSQNPAPIHRTEGPQSRSITSVLSDAWVPPASADDNPLWGVRAARAP